MKFWIQTDSNGCSFIKLKYHLIVAAAIETLDADLDSWKTTDKYANTSELLTQLFGSFLQLRNFVAIWV
ncbi:hypothetical protein QR680_005517 [Steinernema hermaphroditum]|uniref:Uncharacterized protein n=1 Tax=Steinernema hermaphroditum TaxID=289476 RepID=A0AA39HSA6_9BILA|nr:hypothetical protein QR680_005517 [Steinernema hermaphroditum]